MEVVMSRILVVILAVMVAFGAAAPSFAQQDTLEKIKSTGVLIIGTRTGSPPFAYVNKNNEWVGFSIDLVEQFVKPSVEKAVGRQIKVERKESRPPTRIPLLTSNSVDLIAGTMTDTPQRRESVDFSLTFFYTGAQFLVKKGSPLKGINDIAGKRIAAQQGSTNAKILREKYAKAPKPDDWDVVGDFYSEEPYGMAMRKGDAKFKAAVDAGLRKGLEGGKYFELYEKWFGPKGEVPYPMTA